MRRNKIGGRRHARSFQKKRNKTRAINSPTMVMRGGIRL